MALMSMTGAIAQNYAGIIYVTPTGAGTHSGDSWVNATSSIDTAQILAQANNAVVWVAQVFIMETLIPLLRMHSL